MANDNGSTRAALVASDTERSQEAYEALTGRHDWVPLEQADVVVVLGGDGFMLQTLHAMLDSGRIIPAYGMNLGTVGFLMNRYDRRANVLQRIAKARRIRIAPLSGQAVTTGGETHELSAINEVSLLRETRQTAKIEVTVGNRVRIPELVCDGVLVSTPAGSTAYNLSANGPILPLDSKVLALTPISPFRPRRWHGAILPDRVRIELRVLDPVKRPVAAVADQKEFRDIAEVTVEIDHETELELLFDPGQSLEERIVAEQFVTD
ncbi:NAD kinase [Erythrobacter sp. JK5]|uniref:NAD kinase n=1 Tax=Erythrobacter sp. JK5 TaxID=2829500 RepID=UPI001BA7552D|nr:NAD kinase [Erythrobacter sp. JK5]QUL38897.1 NAD kinase [Erythrobacter sp. JK5]